jgi:hypothetical protein
VSAGAGPLIDTTFSNNPKVDADGSFQDYPSPGSAPWTGAFSIGTLGYSNFFKENVYHLKFSFTHAADSLQLDFSSSLFEGKGTDDEGWGLDNVRVRLRMPSATSAANADDSPSPGRQRFR